MNLHAFFLSLKNYRKIFVTGPQRSGTSITSKILAFESGYRCVDEREFEWRNLDLFRQFLESNENLVIQCPGMSHIIEQFGQPENLVVFMQRNPLEILASEKRIVWKSERYGKKLYKDKVSYMPHWFTPLCVLKYLHWHFEQKQLIPNPIDLAYESLQGHPLWIDKEKRARFSAKQISV
jgi:hypothetical protein